MEYIKRIREKPEHVRKNWALGITFVVGSIIFFIWIFGFISSLNAPSIETKAKANISPFKVLKDSFSKTTDEVGTGIQNLSDSLKK